MHFQNSGIDAEEMNDIFVRHNDLITLLFYSCLALGFKAQLLLSHGGQSIIWGVSSFCHTDSAVLN